MRYCFIKFSVFPCSHAFKSIIEEWVIIVGDTQFSDCPRFRFSFSYLKFPVKINLHTKIVEENATLESSIEGIKRPFKSIYDLPYLVY